MDHALTLLFWNVGLCLPFALLAWCLCRVQAVRSRPALCHGIWLLVLLKLVTPPVFPVTVLSAEVDAELIESSAPAHSAEGSGQENGSVAASSPSQTTSEQGAPAVVVEPSASVRADVDRSSPQGTVIRGSESWNRVQLLSVLLAVSLGVSLAIGFAALRQLRMVRRLLRGRSIESGRAAEILREVSQRFPSRSAPRLQIVDASVTPMLWAEPGRPMIVLPRHLVDTLDDDQLRSILAHELGHFVRRDHWSNSFAFVVTALFWWNPVAWFARRELAAAAEACCDALAIECAAGSRKAYARTLLAIVDFVTTKTTLRPALGVTFGRSNSLRTRLETLANESVKTNVSRTGWMLLALGALVLMLWPAYADEPDKRVVELFGGLESVANVKAPQVIEAFRINGDHAKSKDDPPQALGGYPILSGPVKVDAATGRKLAAILLNRDAYEWEWHKLCIFMPGVALRFTNAGAPTEVLLCFSCDQIGVFRDGKRIAIRDDGPARGPLLDLVKQIFPRDEEIGQLKFPEELAEIAEAAVRKQIEQQRYAADRMHASARQALERRDADDDLSGFPKALKRAYPTTGEQIAALLVFEGSTSNWSSLSGGQGAVRTMLEKYSLDELMEPVRKALLSDDRRMRRGAVRACEHIRTLAGWKPDDRGRLYGVRLEVLTDEPVYSLRQRAYGKLEQWASDMDRAQVDRLLDKGLHDAEAGVRRTAMIASGKLRHERSIPVLVEFLEDRPVATRPAPLPPQDEKDYEADSVYDVFAGQRPEAEVAALALGWMRHAPAVAAIEARSDDSPMYEVALAMLGQPARLKSEHFDGSLKNLELQFGALEAVVRCQGRYGLPYAMHDKMALLGTGSDTVLNELKRMLLAAKAPGSAAVAASKKLSDLEAWYVKHGEDYVSLVRSQDK